jgi:hypothetical protein
MTQTAGNPKSTPPTGRQEAIRPFRVTIPEQEIVELRRRIAATRWPTKELVEDRSQGVQLATLRELARYWSTEYDWRKCEARLNALPQFTSEIDGVEVHCIHGRSRHGNSTSTWSLMCNSRAKYRPLLFWPIPTAAVAQK